MAFLNLIINLQAACRRFIQREKDKNVQNVGSFDEIPGTRRRANGQRIATFSCKCCPKSRFGEESEDGTWSLDLERAVGWKNPITMRLSTKDFKRGCRDHVRSKNGRHRFWETVEKVDKMPTSGSVSPSQQDRESLKKGGKILEGLFHKYVESWNGYENINDYEKEGVIIKFEQARRVLQRWNIAISPLSEKRKAPKAKDPKIVKDKRPAKTEKRKAPKTKDPKIVKDKRRAACAGTPSVSAFGVTVTPSLSVFGSTRPPPLTRLLLHAYSTTPPPLTVSTTASPAPQTREEQLEAKVKTLRAQKQRLTAQLAEAMTQAASNAQTAPPGEALQDKHG